MKSITPQLLIRSAILLTAWLAFFVPLKSLPETVWNSDTHKAKLAGDVKHVVEELYTQETPNTRIVTTRTFDKNGNLLERGTALVYKDASKKNSAQRTVLTRNISGQITHVNAYQDDGSLFLTEVNTYDTQGNLTEKVSQRPNTSVKETWAYTYDRSGNKVEEQYSVGGVLRTRSAFDYNRRGKLIKSVSYRPDGSIEYSAIDKYDDQSHLIEIDVYGPIGFEESRRVYKYNEKGLLAEGLLYNASNSLEERNVCEYEFDRVGNWVKQTDSKWVVNSGKLQREFTQITQRTISYYTER